MSAVSNVSATFSFPVRVYYEDTDAGGVVYYANYLKYFERARTEWLRSLGIDQRALAASQGILFVVRSSNVHYRAPGHLDDQLDIRSRITRLGRASLEFEQTCLRADTVLAFGQIHIACVSATSLRPAPIPDDIRSRLEFLAVPGGRSAPRHFNSTRHVAPDHPNPSSAGSDVLSSESPQASLSHDIAPTSADAECGPAIAEIATPRSNTNRPTRRA